MEVKVMQNVLGQNDAVAEEIRKQFAEAGVFALNLLGSPGAGKTTLLEHTLGELAKEMKIAVIEGDLFTTKDADRIEKLGVPVIQINTVGGCHLDAPMVAKAIADMDLKALDFILVENVGNLVCPAEFDVGEDAKAVVLSITEGDDKPLKYPLIFKESSVALLNKVDILPYTNFDLAAATEDIETIHPGIKVLPVSAFKAEGLEPWLSWIRERVAAKRNAAEGKA